MKARTLPSEGRGNRDPTRARTRSRRSVDHSHQRGHGVSERFIKPETTVPVELNEPIAIVGIGGRFPGAAGPEAFWNMLRAGVDGVSDAIPSNRYDFDAVHDPRPGTPGKLYARAG